METKLICECCSKLLADMCNNVWSANENCLLYSKSYDYYFIEARQIAKTNNTKLPTKEHLPQIGQPRYS